MSILKNLNEAIKMARSLTEEEGYGLNEEDFGKVKAAIDAYIAKNKYYFDENRCFDIYVDYNDELGEESIKKIFEDEHPFDAFYDVVGDFNWWESADYEYDEIFKNLDLDEDFKAGYRDNIMEYLMDYIGYNIPYGHFDTTVGYDVYMKDPEGANTDYSEKFLTYEDVPEGEDEYGNTVIGVNSGVKKFLELNGKTETDFIAAVNKFFKDGTKLEKFYDDLLNEINNCTYEWGNEWVFLGQASILDGGHAIQDKGEIIIPAGTMCGLTNGSNGSGSILGITTEKEIRGKIGTDFDLFYKNGYHYNVDEINGLVSSCWNNNLKFGE